jgi:phosphoesterase RecJ-like protein
MDISQQIVKLITYAKHILLVDPINTDGDSLGSVLALYLVCKKLGKEVDMISVGKISEMYKFLPEVDKIKENFGQAQELVISLDCSETKPQQLNYQMDGDKLKIFIKPEKGAFDIKKLETHQEKLDYDLIIILDTANFSLLGNFYKINKDLFLEKATINIDHHASNQYFAKVNLVEPNATSTTEILVPIIKSLGEDLIDAAVATCLLTGIVLDTWSFQNTSTTPQALALASELYQKGADLVEISRNICQAKPLSILKLWGRILSNLKYDQEHRLAWSKISFNDLKECQTEETESTALMNQFLGRIKDSDIVLLLSEKEPGKIKGGLRRSGKEKIDLAQIATQFGGGGHEEAAGFEIEGKLEETEHSVVEAIKEFQRKRLA